MSGERLAAAIHELTEALREELRTEAAGHPQAPDRLLSVHEAATRLGIGRTAAYGELQTSSGVVVPSLVSLSAGWGRTRYF